MDVLPRRRQKAVVSWMFQPPHARRETAVPKKSFEFDWVEVPPEKKNCEFGKVRCHSETESSGDQDSGDCDFGKNSKPYMQKKDEGDEGLVPLPRRRHKAVVEWQFGQGYKRGFAGLEGGSVPGLDSQHKPFRSRSSSQEREPQRYAPGVRVSLDGKFSVREGKKSCQKSAMKMKIEGGRSIQGDPFPGYQVIGWLQDFRRIYHEFVEEAKENGTLLRSRPDLAAYDKLRENNESVDEHERIVGSVAGVNVGDIFNFRVELCIVGLHCQLQRTIDVILQDGNLVATSIVVNSSVPDDDFNLEVVVFSSPLESTIDQKIDGANRALKRSMDIKSPVRVVYAFIMHDYSKHENRKRRIGTYIYCGLYGVEKYWRDNKKDGTVSFMFRLRRFPEQPHVELSEVVQFRKSQAFTSAAYFLNDISHGLEKTPISVINSIDGEELRPFVYMTKLKYPLKHLPRLCTGCECTNGCSDSLKCACAVKNGGELPFNHDGLLVEAKPLVYECGPLCQCPPTCHNRVGQHGIKFRLEIFKTKSMGWGVRSKDYIPSGSFVCEYIGEILEDDEAQKRTIDEYLFGIGNNYHDESLWQGLKTSIPSLQKELLVESDEGGFAVDASQCGNVAKFINHSCTPNMFAQNVLYDHDNKSMPHVMFFATDDIPPMQELNYDYNYKIDAVYDSNGNIKKKKCFCGTIECTGWLY